MGSPSWTDVVQAIGAIGSLLIALVGFVFIIRQIRQVERSIRGDVSERLYTQNMELLRLLADNPEMVKYFYHNVDIREGDADYDKALIVAEVTASFFELVVLQLSEVPEPGRSTWTKCMRDSYDSSPLLRRYLAEYADWYAADLQRICCPVGATTSEPAEKVAPDEAPTAEAQPR